MRWGLLLTLLPTLAVAQADALEAQKLKLEQLRAEVADQVQLQAFDLVDELVLGWKQKPVFTLETPVVVAEVTVPVGFGSGLTAAIENHLLSVLLKNRDSHLLPSHCPACMATVVHSGPTGTIVSRGVDEPEALKRAALASGATHALFLDFEIEGAALVLRAHLTSLEPGLPIVQAKTLTTTTSAAALLRAGEHLKTQEEARAEYLEALAGRGILLAPLTVGLEMFAAPEGGTAQASPLPWVKSGIEVAMTRARGWVASVMLGITFLPQVHYGWSAYGRIERLLGLSSSLTTPDVYVFLAGGLFSIYGTGALAFRASSPTLKEIADSVLPGREPNATIGTGQVGLEVRVKNRLGAGFYIEAAPFLDTSPNIGNFINLFGLIRFHSYGFEVNFWF
jgi:hypothetical protein